MKISAYHYFLLIVLLICGAGIARAIPGFHIHDDASVEKAVREYADHSDQFRPCVYQAYLDKSLWRLALAAHAYLQQKPGDAERECSFAQAYWQSQEYDTNEKVPADAATQLKGLYNEALQDTKDAANKLPHSVAAHLTYGQYLQYFVMGTAKVPQMLHEYKAAVALMPASGELHFRLADALFSSGDFSPPRIAEMISEYKKAVQLDPHLAESYSGIAASYWQEKDWQGVKIYIDKYVAARPDVANRADVVAMRKTLTEKLGHD